MAYAGKNNKSESEDKSYYKNKILSFLRASTSRSSYIKYTMLKCYDYFEGQNIQNPYKSLANVFNISKKTAQGTATLKMPTIFTDLNHIKSKIRSLVGELENMGFTAEVTSINKEAQSRRLDLKAKVMTDMAMKPYVDMAAVETGIHIGMQEDLPQSKEELEERFKNKNYKDVSDLCMEACLRYSLQYWNYLLMRFQLFRDVAISGECHAETAVVNGFPQILRHNPVNVFFTINPNDDDLLSFTNAKGIVKYSDVNEVMNQYDLTNDQIEELKSLGQSGGTEPYLGILYNGLKYFEPFLEDKKHVLVCKWKWTDDVVKAGVEITYEDGRTEFRVMDVSDKKVRIDKKMLGIPDDASFKVGRKKISTLKKGTLIGGQLLVDCGEEEFMIRDNENVSMALSPIVSYKPEYHNGSNTSEVAQLMKIQDLRNYIMTMVTLEVTKAGGNALAIDVSKLPKEWGANPTEKMGKVLHYLKGFGIIPYNSSEGEGLPGSNAIPVQRFDAGIGSVLQTYVTELMPMLEAEMDKISGINNARLGNIQSANQLKGVTELALSQSNSITKYLYRGFFEFESRLLTYHCQHIKMTWIYNPERFTPIIGDFYFDFLKQDVDITMDTHAARVKPEPLSMETMRQYLLLAVQSNSLTIDQAFKLEMDAADNIREAAYKYIDEVEDKRDQDQKFQAQMQQLQQQGQAQSQQQMAAMQQQMQQQQQQANMDQQRLKSLTDYKKKMLDDQTKKYIADAKYEHEALSETQD